MDKHLRICFTSDTHGYLYPTDYTDNLEKDIGLMKLASAFHPDGNTLLLDGGDTLQGSPMTNYYQRLSPEKKAAVMPDASLGIHPFAAMMNACGYQYVTLGNHDFNYGVEGLRDYLKDLRATCLCCNIRDRAHRLPIHPWTVHTLENGLRVGLVGACTDFVRFWENPATVAELEITDPVAACARALEEVRPLCDVTVLLYHGGFERDLATGRRLTESKENQACRICGELDFDLVLTGHQHVSVPPQRVGNSWACQPPFRAAAFCELEVTRSDDGALSVTGKNRKGEAAPLREPVRLLAELERQVQRWLDTPVGHLDAPLDVREHIPMALEGCPLANFINTVLLELTGAQVSGIAMANEVKGLPREVTIRNVVAAYIYSNTLLVLDMTVEDLKRYMEQCAAYFALEEDGSVRVSDAFMQPKVAHYNYDYFAGVDYVYDIRRPVGSRLASLKLAGRELADDSEHVSVCVTSYRYNGTGGFDMLPTQPVLKDVQVDVADAIIDYLLRHPEVRVDRHAWGRVVTGQKEGF